MAAYFNRTSCELQQFWVIPLTVFSILFICLLRFLFACSFMLLRLFSAFGVESSNVFNMGLICFNIATWSSSKEKKIWLEYFKTTEQHVPTQNPDFMFLIKKCSSTPDHKTQSRGISLFHPLCLVTQHNISLEGHKGVCCLFIGCKQVRKPQRKRTAIANNQKSWERRM